MTLIFLILFLVLIALVVKSSLGKPGIFLKAGIHILGGIVGLWLGDLVLSLLGFAIPINVFTVVVVGLLGFPGVVALAALQIVGV